MYPRCRSWTLISVITTATHKPASPFLQSLYEGLRGLCPSCRTPPEQKLILSSPPHHNLRVCRVCKARSDVIDKHDQKVSSGAIIACDILKIDHLCKNCYYFKNPEQFILYISHRQDSISSTLPFKRMIISPLCIEFYYKVSV